MAACFFIVCLEPDKWAITTLQGLSYIDMMVVRLILNRVLKYKKHS